MNNHLLMNLRQFFLAYADRYISASHDPAPLRLKKDHTLRVCREIVLLGRDLGLDDNGLMLAEAMALMHDLGRFRQYERYRTFLDHKSENHARLGLKEMAAHRVLAALSRSDRLQIKTAVAFHNAAEIPACGNEKMTFFIRLLRDADKLDIWRVVIENYTDPRPESRDVINLGLENDDGFSHEALDAILSSTFVKSRSIQRLNDLKLMQISWVFDLNFLPAISRVAQRGYVDTIAATLPEHPEIIAALTHVRGYLHQTLAAHAVPLHKGRGAGRAAPCFHSRAGGER